ncbi:MAG: outer membrane lipoprotein-sorting protein [Bacillota bacterium]|nr:outer membrane lipoprotein-sorting protein [Bacillota bacterium]HHU62318.1 outer membrane lipoprotein-sorting protein [Natronincola sp.]
MKKIQITISFVLLILMCNAIGFAQDYTHIEKVLERIDARTAFNDKDFSALVSLIVEDPEKGIEKIVLRQFMRDDGNQFLLLIQEPSASKGQGHLRDGDNLWMYDPSSRKFSHTSLKENFQDSDARNSDFAGEKLTESYRVEGYEEGTLGNFQVYIVSLAAISDNASVPYAKMWITKDSELILKMEEYSLNRRLLRTNLYPKYAKVGDSVIPVQMVFVDELVEGQKTQMNLSEISTKDIPDHVFTKAYVERVSR